MFYSTSETILFVIKGFDTDLNICNSVIDKYLLQTRIQYNNDNKNQNILGEQNILYLRKKNPWKLKTEAYWAEKACKTRRADWKNNPDQMYSCARDSALRYNGDLNDGPPMMDHHCTMVSRGQRGPQLGPKIPRYASLSDSKCWNLVAKTQRWAKMG